MLAIRCNKRYIWSEKGREYLHLVGDREKTKKCEREREIERERERERDRQTDRQTERERESEMKGPNLHGYME